VPEPPDPPAGALTYDPELGPGYFIQARSDFMRAEHVSSDAKVLYAILLSYCGAGDQAWPGVERLGRECGSISRPTVRKALGELQALGLITVTRRGLTQTNLYHVHKLPLVMPTNDGKKLSIRKQESIPARKQAIAHKVQSEQIQTVETGMDPELANAIRTFAGRCRQNVTPEQVAALAARAGTLARWQAVSAGAGALQAVERALGEG
jgi:hypothetical protein